MFDDYGGEWEAHRRDPEEATSQTSVKWRKSAGDGTPFLVIEAISPQESLTLDQHLTARAKRRGKSAQARLLELLLTTLPIFPCSHVMRGHAHMWVWEGSTPPQGCQLLDSEPVVTAPARS